MRIPSGSTDRWIFFKAVDATDLKTPEPGLSGFTVSYELDNGGSVDMTTPTVTESDATNKPGVYRLLIDESGMTTLDSAHDTEELEVTIKHASMAPVDRVIEVYRPKFTEGQSATMANSCVDSDVERFAGTAGTFSGGRPEVNVSHLAGVQQSLTDLKHFADSGYDPATSKVEGVKTADALTTNNDKTGYGLSAAAVTAIWAALTSALTTVGSVGKKLADWVLGSDSKAVLSADAHTGAVVPTVTTLTGHTPQTGDSFARIGALGAGLTAITDKTSALPADPASQAAVLAKLPAALVGGRMASNAEVVGDKTGYALTSGERDAIATALLDLADGVETSQTVRKALRAMASTLAGDVTGGPGSPVHKSLGGSTDRVSSTADVDGNRTVVLST